LEGVWAADELGSRMEIDLEYYALENESDTNLESEWVGLKEGYSISHLVDHLAGV
jgi:hypothetical protein